MKHLSIQPCHKCGNEPFIAKIVLAVGEGDASYFAQCKKCGIQGESKSTIDEAIFSWNEWMESWEGEFPKLKPCPFCGHEIEMRMCLGLNRWIVGCSNPECVIYSHTPKEYDTRRETIQAWNRRAKDE